MNDGYIEKRLGGTVYHYLEERSDSNMRVPDEVRQCVVFLGIIKPDHTGAQRVYFVGTAFFIGVRSDATNTTNYIYLVTAKHVAEALENKPFVVRINTKNGDSSIVDGTNAKWWYHPTDISVDAAVIAWAPDAGLFEYKNIPTSMFLTKETITEKGIGVGDEVFITGLFSQLCGTSKNLPIIRVGNIAMMDEEKVPVKRYGEIDAFLVEARSIGGISGSPVFVRETTPLGGAGSYYLLGLMHGHWDIPPELKNDNSQEDINQGGLVNMGIAIVVPASKICEIIYRPELVELRRSNDKKLKYKNLPKED